MKQWLIKFFAVIMGVLWMGNAMADVEACYKAIENALTEKLKSETIDYKDENLAGKIAALLQPVLDSTIKDNKECKAVQDELVNVKGAVLDVNMGNGYVFDIEMEFADSTADSLTAVERPAELDVLLPWYGILIVKKGSLDKYANAEVPIISTEYMKRHRTEFYPAESDKFLGWARGCTHSNHMAHDKDVVNRAAHIVMDEDDSFVNGNDYYVYDGEDVYWGTATLVGEVAMALITFGWSSYAQMGKISAQTAKAAANATKVQKAVEGAKGVTKVVDASADAANVAKLTDAAKLEKAIKAAEAAESGRKGASSRAAARTALKEIGVEADPRSTGAQLKNIANILKTTQGTFEAVEEVKWVTSLWKPWRLAKQGIQGLAPKNLAALYGNGVKWTQKIKRAAVPVVAGGIGWAILKSFGYSSASAELDAGYADNVKFNSFGLLSADDIENRENEVSHGAWIMFEEAGAVQEDDPLKEAGAFAEDLQQQMSIINAQKPYCDVDIYVVQPGISNPQAMGKREVYYVIQNPAGSWRVSSR